MMQTLALPMIVVAMVFINVWGLLAQRAASRREASEAQEAPEWQERAPETLKPRRRR